MHSFDGWCVASQCGILVVGGPNHPLKSCGVTPLGGQYTPKTGKYAGRVFASYRQYLNIKSKDEGYENFSQRTEARKEIRDYIDDNDINIKGIKKLTTGDRVTSYESDNIDEILQLAALQAPNAILHMVIYTNKSIGMSKGRRDKPGWSTLLNNTRASAYKKMYETGQIQEYIDDRLDSSDYDVVEIVSVQLWVR